MKFLAVVVIAVAMIGISSADEDKRTKILKFWKCVSCTPAMHEEYMKCATLKPEKGKKISEECKSKILPDATTLEQRMERICKNEAEEAEQLYECIMKDEYKKDLTDEEKTQFKEFVNCLKKIGAKFCQDQ